MGRLFGTDGVRGVAGTELTAELAAGLGRAAVTVLGRHGAGETVVVVGRDPRASGVWLEEALTGGIRAAGGDVILAGVEPTPAIAYMTVDLGASAGVVISASHNPAEDNGIKFFSREGRKLPDAIDGRTAAASFLKGLTADMLVGGCGKVQPGQTILVHAAAGGMGSLLVQWIHAIGATVIAHAGSPEKAAKARALGADHALSCPFDELAAEVRRLTNGHGVDTVIDGVGKASWDASLDSLAKRGLMISYGNASGAVPSFAPLELMRRGSLFLTRPTMGDYSDTPADRGAAAKRLFDMIASGKLKIEIGQTFALADAADAHRALEARQTTGSTVLLP